MMRRKHILFVLLAFCILKTTASASSAVRHFKISSPDGRLEARVEVSKTLAWSLYSDGKEIIAPSQVSMTLSDGTVFGKDSRFIRSKTESVDATVKAIGYKRSVVRDRYNSIRLCFKGFDLEFRAFDDGVAYRFVSHIGKGFNVKEEQASFNFSSDFPSYVPYVRSQGTLMEQLRDDFQNIYTKIPLSEWDQSQLVFLPVLVDAGEVSVLLTESDLRDYPGMLLVGQGSACPKSFFAPFPSRWEGGGHRNLEMPRLERADYIAEVPSDRSFPWRIAAVAREDMDLLNSDIVFNTATPPDNRDWSWIRYGSTAWDWWNDWSLRGVDFKAGINTKTYEYYIDFAARFGLPYVLLDEGWAVQGAADLFQVVPELDLQHLVEYGSERGVGLLLWAGCNAFGKDMENVCRKYSEMGIKGFKVDFLNHDDQLITAFMWKAAEVAAKYKLILDFHGCAKPAGLDRTWPNVLGFEGVFGLEQMKWREQTDQPDYDVTMPYIRMFAGPVDYTQGAMGNVIESEYHPSRSHPVSLGTRCHQLAEYVVFLSPLGVMCDSPSNYYAEQECARLIASISTVWDETVPLSGKIGESVAVARRSGNSWYIGVLSGWSGAEMLLNLGFLNDGTWTATIFKDGPNADKTAMDYVVETTMLSSSDDIKVTLLPGGGWFARLERL